MDALPDSPGGDSSLPSDAESLPVDAQSLPSVAESLPDDKASQSDPELISMVVPVPGEMCDGDVPRDGKDDLPGTCCAKNCSHLLCQDLLSLEWQTLKVKLSNDDVNDFIYKLLLVMRGVGETSRSSSIRFKLFGHKVCRTAFRDCVGIGNSKLNRLQGWLKLGHMQPPRDLRHSSVAERKAAGEMCDGALQWAYDILAESMNSSDVHPADRVVDAIVPELKVEPDAADMMFCALPTLDGFCEWVHGPGATVTSTAADAGEVKWLPPMALIDLFDMCKEQMSASPAYITFFRCYNENWKHCLRFRVKIMQSKCDDCERFKLLRKQATTPERAEAVRAEHLEHVRSTFHDRAVDERIQKAAYDATTTRGGVPLGRSILNMDIDAMEAMKFKCPRNLPGAKMLSTLWRPQQHMVGSILDGCSDHFWLVPPDIVILN